MVNGSTVRKMATASSSSPIKATILDSSGTIRLREKEDCTIPTAITIKASGRMIRLTATAPTSPSLVASTRATGRRTNATVKERRPGPTAPYLKGTISSTRSLEPANFFTIMGIPIRG